MASTAEPARDDAPSPLAPGELRVPPVPAVDLPWLSARQMAEVDRVMTEELGVELLQMMELAGRHLAHLARHRCSGADPRGEAVTVLAGTGGNGGGALAAARRLAGWGAEVRVVLALPPERLDRATARQLEILRALEVPYVVAGEVEEALESGDAGGAEEVLGRPELILDGLVGYSLQGAPRGPMANVIRWANLQDAPVLALDVPSGLDATSGMVFSPAIQAAATLTLALPKEGLRAAAARRQTGELYLADIGVPPLAYRRLGLEVGPLFAAGEILRLVG